MTYGGFFFDPNGGSGVDPNSDPNSCIIGAEKAERWQGETSEAWRSASRKAATEIGGDGSRSSMVEPSTLVGVTGFLIEPVTKPA